MHQVGTLADGRPFLAMKLIKGSTLETILKYRPDPSADRAPAASGLAIFEAVCQAVGYAHAHRVIHRDLKPANVMVGAFGEVQVMDWGLAKFLGEGSPGTADALSADETQAWTRVSPAPASGSHTEAGSLVGTPAYIPPEQAVGQIEQVDERADVFGLGAILAVILTGKPPYVGESFESVRVQAVRGKLEDCFARLDACGAEPEWVALCKNCLAFDPADRPADAGAVAQAVAGLRAAADERARRADLERVQAEADARAADARAAEQRQRRRMLLAASGIIALVLLAGLSVSLWQMRRAMQAEAEANTNEQKAKQSQQDTANALKVVESEKTRAVAAEGLARSEEEAGRKLLYTTDMRLAPFVWRDDRSTAEQLRVLLARHIPESPAGSGDPRRAQDEVGGMAVDALGAGLPTPSPGRPKFSSPRPPSPHEPKSDLRGFEWYYYQHLLESSALVFSGHGKSVVHAAFTAEGPLVTLDQNGQVRRWNLGSQHEEEASRHDLPGGPGAQLRVLSPSGRLAALAEGNTVHVFDTSTGNETFQIDSSKNQPRRLIFSRDGDWLVIVDDKVRWCSAVSGEVFASVDQKFNRIESLALTDNGLTLAVVGHGGSGNFASIFHLDAAAKQVTGLPLDLQAGGTLNASALTPDGRRIAVSAKLSGALFVLNAATGRSIARHTSAHASPIAAMAFSGDGARLATADAEGTIKIWADVEKLGSKSAALLKLKGHQGAINTVGFSSDNKRLVTASADKTARVWDLDNAGAAIRPLEGLSNGSSFAIGFSPDGQLIAAANGRSVRLWDAATGRLVRELSPGGEGGVASVAFSPSDNRLLAVGYGGDAKVSYVALWDIDAGTERARLTGATDLPNFPVDEDTGPVGALAFSPDGKYLVAGFGVKNYFRSAVYPNPLKVWEVATRRLIRRLNGHTNFCVSLDFSRDGSLLASGSHDGTAIIWLTATWKAMHTLRNPDHASLYSQTGRGQVEDVAFAPDGKTLALASREGNVQFWDVAAGKLLETLKGHSSAVNAVAFSPDGRTLASSSSDQTVRLWNFETRRELMQLDPGGVTLGRVQTLAFSPDGRHLLARGGGTAFWLTTPIVWNDPERAAETLRLLLHSNADFPSRIRILSEDLRLHEALAKLDANDKRVQAALAATQANWHASRQAWDEAVAALDRLAAADPSGPVAWLRTPGLLRLATALVHQNRPAVAAMLLQGGAQRRNQDGVPTAIDEVGVGVAYASADGPVRVTELLPGFPGSRAGLVPGDTILKVNDTELTRESIPNLGKLLAGDAGTKVRLTVRHPGSEKPAVIELTRERFVNDSATGELLSPLRALVEERLAKEPRDAGLLELCAELAGQWSDWKAQVADYTAAIESLARQKPEAVAADLERLYGRRGNAHVALQQWQKAVDDYARAVTDATTDDALLSNQCWHGPR